MSTSFWTKQLDSGMGIWISLLYMVLNRPFVRVQADETSDCMWTNWSWVSTDSVSSLLIPQDSNDEDVALFDAEEDTGKRPKSTIK